jgi:pyridoxal phosphate enzyme (YggS family)
MSGLTYHNLGISNASIAEHPEQNVIRVTENFRKIQDLLANAAKVAGRTPNSVRLLAASKTQSPETVLEAISCGQRDFGENFAQEGIDKMQAIGRDDLIWHFIGHLQSNKTRAVAENFDWVHTVDRLKIAERLSKQRPYYAADLNVCIQIDIDNEDSKHGIPAKQALELAKAVNELPKLRLRGLMCIPMARHGFDEQREPFARMHQLSEEIAVAGLENDTLSMGMTGDFPAAIAEGATIVRIGTALFGPRQKTAT